MLHRACVVYFRDSGTFGGSRSWMGECKDSLWVLCVCVCVCRITVTHAKLTHRAIFTPGQGVDLLLRDFTVLSAACGERRGSGRKDTQQEHLIWFQYYS